MEHNILGWDIGGAHVKAALLDNRGNVVKVSLLACPLWKGLPLLQERVARVMDEFSGHDCLHAVTMTGELVDLFENRIEGVSEIIRIMQKFIKPKQMLIYAGNLGFLTPDKLNQQACRDIALANWLATASYSAAKIETGLFMDIGSTTTDILLLSNGQVEAQGYTDYQRLVSAELVYTGIVRTAVMAVAQEAVFNGQKMGLMAEFFATMADVYRLTGDLNEAHDLSETADGGAKTPEASARRLSRMTGFDFSTGDWPIWLEFANYLKRQQINKIMIACKQQLARIVSSVNCYLIGAGIGRFLVKEIAGELGYPYLDFNGLIEHSNHAAIVDCADCAPAVAVAALCLNTGFCDSVRPV